jgi:hypothetical protein
MSWRSFIAELYPQRDLENSSIGRSVKARHRDHAPSLSDVFPEDKSPLFKEENGMVGRAIKEPFLDIFGTLSSIELCSRNGQLISLWFHASIHSAQLSSAQ